jgi:hypothetical protein
MMILDWILQTATQALVPLHWSLRKLESMQEQILSMLLSLLGTYSNKKMWERSLVIIHSLS